MGFRGTLPRLNRQISAFTTECEVLHTRMKNFEKQEDYRNAADIKSKLKEKQKILDQLIKARADEISKKKLDKLKNTDHCPHSNDTNNKSLPYGWIVKETERGPVYIDHPTQRATLKDPRLDSYLQSISGLEKKLQVSKNQDPSETLDRIAEILRQVNTNLNIYKDEMKKLSIYNENKISSKYKCNDIVEVIRNN